MNPKVVPIGDLAGPAALEALPQSRGAQCQSRRR